MNKEGEQVIRSQCKKCKYREHSPLCMWQVKGKCERFERWQE